ncbi:hypothetical protein GCM10017600_02380 [Streptosporangium carneum]|uniref:Uncharacterized protein n=1 Tax=Streptosporangium carneum TaxID=47481 RepID=A0A9W6HWF4_9ACTN|nr:hypothetical protein GCM10017600_02380 [Streptosporangium carneum]
MEQKARPEFRAGLMFVSRPFTDGRDFGFDIFVGVSVSSDSPIVRVGYSSSSPPSTS